MKWTRRFPPGSGILPDAIGYMNGELTRGKYPEKVRRIVYWDDEQKRKFIFFTNALDISPMMVAELYHNRWQIELFFKWLKQHLKIKKFWGGVRERREDPNIHRNNRLLYDGNRAEKDGNQQAYL